MISSLLSLQSRTVEDQSAVDALNESQSRVLSMSLIHQNLYKDGPSSHLNVKDYITNLTTHLFHTYNINKDKIGLELEVDEVDLDVATLVPLGLIINELVTNALKYAFAGKEKGTVKVTFKHNENSLFLTVNDDGIGQTPMENTSGFGSRLVATFAKKLDAEIIRTFDKGTSVSIQMNNFKKAI